MRRRRDGKRRKGLGREKGRTGLDSRERGAKGWISRNEMPWSPWTTAPLHWKRVIYARLAFLPPSSSFSQTHSPSRLLPQAFNASPNALRHPQADFLYVNAVITLLARVVPRLLLPHCALPTTLKEECCDDHTNGTSRLGERCLEWNKVAHTRVMVRSTSWGSRREKTAMKTKTASLPLFPSSVSLSLSFPSYPPSLPSCPQAPHASTSARHTLTSLVLRCPTLSPLTCTRTLPHPLAHGPASHPPFAKESRLRICPCQCRI
ncbi:hypothetical protein CPC08DRAFT_448719 [Agrocybe pediades]|nr:hypothetical protein CPC08DRAFT_448719 [Agrocybe pediades]